jgi:hypothetical protein
MLAIRRNTEKDFRIILKTEREEDNYEVQIVLKFKFETNHNYVIIKKEEENEIQYKN